MRAYASNAQLPLKDAAITVTAVDGTVLAMRLTDRNGKITPIAIPTPDFSDSQTPGSPEVPFTVITLTAQLRGYEQIRAENIQIFPDTTTFQELEMIPLSELPESWNKSETFKTPPQNL